LPPFKNVANEFRPGEEYVSTLLMHYSLGIFLFDFICLFAFNAGDFDFDSLLMPEISALKISREHKNA
jgi:hypothetical protein